MIMQIDMKKLFGTDVWVVAQDVADNTVERAPSPLCGPSRMQLSRPQETPEDRVAIRTGMTVRAEVLIARCRADGLEVY